MLLDILLGFMFTPSALSALLGLALAGVICSLFPHNGSCAELGGWIVGICFSFGLLYDLVLKPRQRNEKRRSRD
jgi:hypothetical protein